MVTQVRFVDVQRPFRRLGEMQRFCELRALWEFHRISSKIEDDVIVAKNIHNTEWYLKTIKIPPK